MKNYVTPKSPSPTSGSNKCELCNIGYLVERKGIYGLFFGCTNYPICRNSRSVEQPNSDNCGSPQKKRKTTASISFVARMFIFSPINMFITILAAAANETNKAADLDGYRWWKRGFMKVQVDKKPEIVGQYPI